MGSRPLGVGGRVSAGGKVSYLDRFHPPIKIEPSAPTEPAFVRARVETAVANCPPQYHARHIEPLSALVDQYQTADDFEREILIGEIDDRLATFAARSIHWHRLPRFLAGEPGETPDQYLTRCYHASGFMTTPTPEPTR